MSDLDGRLFRVQEYIYVEPDTYTVRGYWGKFLCISYHYNNGKKVPIGWDFFAEDLGDFAVILSKLAVLKTEADLKLMKDEFLIKPENIQP